MRRDRTVNFNAWTLLLSKRNELHLQKMFGRMGFARENHPSGLRAIEVLEQSNCSPFIGETN